jgi:transcriptional regulator with PAS, ATPase and Fis domain
MTPSAPELPRHDNEVLIRERHDTGCEWLAPGDAVSRTARPEGTTGFGRLVGESRTLQRAIRDARAAAQTNVTVLLAGENGTGKEIMARAIHEESSRSNGPFIAVNCAALPEGLIESELFGHEKGSFTGATQARRGRFELAHGGTLFFDEVGELTPAMQVKLLRVLQERMFERVGGTQTHSVDIRLIAASNRNLEREAERGVFRQDLFYRLNVVPVTLPPLRDRREDMPLLVDHFILKTCQKHGRPVSAPSPLLLEILTGYDWPGNIRELENVMERLVVLSNEPLLGTAMLPEKLFCSVPQPSIADQEMTFEGAVAAFKKRLISSAIQAEGGVKSAAARRLGISRSYLHKLITDLSVIA